MSLPVVSLFSLASRVVLAQDLDTRELPRHLHKEIEQYRRLRGDWTLLSVKLQVSAVWRVNIRIFKNISIFMDSILFDQF